MKILVIGSGGREHAMVWKIAKSPLVSKIYAAPGNAGTASIAENVNINAMDIAKLAEFAESNKIDLSIIGPESPLIAGIVDEFQKRGLKVFGPNAAAAQMEGSKIFAKKIMSKYNVPTAECKAFDNSADAIKYIDEVSAKSGNPIVVKADGEAAGKGVYVCANVEDAKTAVIDILDSRIFGASGNTLIIEEYLDGQEATFMCFVDGLNYVPMMPSQDYKRAYDNDKGLNTGGMGCYSPVPALTDELIAEVKKTIIEPTLKALMDEGIHFKGILYCGLALTSKGPKVVEFNVRFGDPETQVVLPLLETDLVEIMLAICDNKLNSIDIKWADKKSLSVVLASGGYPGDYEKGKVISGIEEAERLGTAVFHAGTAVKDGYLVTSGGRVLAVSAVGDSYKDCIDKVYAGVEKISFDGMHFRKDIGARVL